jgi:hypothetical protein
VPAGGVARYIRHDELLMHDVLVVLGRGVVLSETPWLEGHWGSRVWVEGGKVVGRQQVGPCSGAFQHAQESLAVWTNVIVTVIIRPTCATVAQQYAPHR